MTTLSLIMTLSLMVQLPDQKSVHEKVPSIAETIANVAAHEKNITDMDAKWTVKWKLLKENFGHPDAITHRTHTSASVIQGQYYRFEQRTKGETIGKKEDRIHRLYAYDGSKTRSKAGEIINVQDSLVNHKSYAFRPHGVLLMESGVEVPLSLWLTGGNQLKTHPDASYFSSYYEVESSVIGFEKIRDIQCLKIKVSCKSISQGWGSGENLIWISPQHNYLPIRHEGFSLDTSTTIPVSVGEVLKFKELEEGIWLPESWKNTIYGNLEIKKSGTKKILGTYEGTLDSFDLHPKYDIEFFRNFDYPTGAIYYELNAAGKITRGGTIHRDAKTGLFSWTSTTYTIVLLTILLILFLVYLFRDRVFRFGYS